MASDRLDTVTTPLPSGFRCHAANLGVKDQTLDFVVVVAAAVVICFLATLYPSRQAARLDPVQALRYE